uniref:Uncharacterized protein n=1 Tax=Vitis vinifera TaxID=29760 RepID=A5C104_VITVI|nr:hypothetical protein VITISV_036969 [Vitis vinifera]
MLRAGASTSPVVGSSEGIVCSAKGGACDGSVGSDSIGMGCSGVDRIPRCKSNSKDVFLEDEWLGFLFLGVKEARFINFVDYSRLRTEIKAHQLIEHQSTGHTLAGHESNGAVAREGANFKRPCGGDFMSKNLEEAMDFLNYVAKVLRGWDKPNRGEVGRMKSQPNGLNVKVRDVKAMITLRSGKEVELPTPKPHDETESEKETEKREEIKGKKKDSSGRKEDHDSTVNEDLEKIVINEDVMKKHMPPPFPQALHGKKGINNTSKILQVLRQVKVNIPLLDMIKQVPTYAKFLKDLCTIKRGLNVNKKAFLTEQGKLVEKALLDLGASVNLLPYSVYKQLGLGELKPTSITLSLADRSMKIRRGMIEDVLVQVDNFYYPMDFVVLDTDPIVKGTNYVPIILGRPFLATSNAIINCRNGLMQLTFGNMTLELNIFYMCKKLINPKE